VRGTIPAISIPDISMNASAIAISFSVKRKAAESRCQ